MVIVPVSDGVWVGCTGAPQASGHPEDRRAAAGLPPWRHEEFLGARGLLRRMLARYAPDAADAPLARHPSGRPALAGRPDIGVSLSHDEGFVAAAVALDRPVGVDVQRPPDAVGDRLLRRCLGPRAADLADLPAAHRATEFAWVWTVQESCVKAEGTGLAGRPWAISVPVRPRRGRWRDVTWVSLRDHTDMPVSCAFGEAPC